MSIFVNNNLKKPPTNPPVKHTSEKATYYFLFFSALNTLYEFA